MFFRKPTTVPPASEALPGRGNAIAPPARHFVLGNPMAQTVPPGMEEAIFGMGCFWGAERLFWQIGEGIWTTAVGYSGGHTPNPSYEETCTGRTGHNEVVRIIFDAKRISYPALLKTFWENHDPTQGMRQGNDVGTQYRSGIYVTSPTQRTDAENSRAAYGEELRKRGLGEITTEIVDAGPFYFAEEYHQQYLAKNPGGYCGLGGTGIACPIGIIR